MGIRGRILAVIFAGIVPQIFFLCFWLKSDINFGTYLLISIAGSLCSIVVASLVVQNALTRWGLLEAASKQLGDGNYSARVQVKGRDEIARIAETFNQMAQKLEEREHRFTELDELKSEFVSRVSHELRTPLTTIKALTRLLMRQDLTDQKQREYLETISGECDRQIELVLNLLDLSRIEGGVYRLSFKKVDLAEIASICIKTEINAAERRGHRLIMESFDEVPPVRADPNTLRRVLMNLIENSIKYTPDGGVITLSGSGGDGYATISVTDNGRGIPHKDLPILFDKFYRGDATPAPDAVGLSETDLFEDANVSGIGLGLYVARWVMEKMDGQISVETEVGRGSTFTLHLPVWTESDGDEQPSGRRSNAEAIISS